MEDKSYAVTPAQAGAQNNTALGSGFRRNDDKALTPLMQQYHDLKSRYPEEVLLFRLGDFYELFGEDARNSAPVLEVALTHRQEVPMCGVPAHSVEPYIAKLLKAG